ncbi:GNAT family N-acetyltransferase [Leuconostoc lactis]|uniref:GNAT family N-acetyltransferase n=1 Tax=Leuconostoc lactis TaxID=1246 RepID=A0A6L7A6A8_LEULA|nr:GNAT family N-acetyltransferase [Leuconostoc lactis]MCT8386956.1 N-acetyltransferase [Leuconostoc lactis]MWN21106.1 GNAT family N-acetyltransferase [Leuconostoc lactis]
MITYKEMKAITPSDLNDLYNSVQWFAYTRDLNGLEQAIRQSLCVITAWDEQKLVGLVRIVGDGLTIIYIQDLLVQPNYQNQKIGTTLMTTVLNRYKQVRQRVLLTDDAPDVRKFYEKNGFISADQGNTVAFYNFSQ